MHIFLYEWITGGGLVEEPSPLPETLLIEGEAMLTALVSDFATIPETRVTILRDARLDPLTLHRCQVVDVHSCEHHLEEFSRLAAKADHTIVIASSGLVTITGGKWTTYRHMGEDVINKASAAAGLDARPCITTDMPLRGATKQALPFPLDVYGTDGDAVAALCAERPEWNALIHPNLPYKMGEVVWGARYEMGRTVEDALARRTRALLLDARASVEAAPAVAAVLAAELGRDTAWAGAQVAEYTDLAERYMLR